jgi:CRP/FNR family transcriptional regulator, cyclic AMP receptor protein
MPAHEGGANAPSEGEKNDGHPAPHRRMTAAGIFDILYANLVAMLSHPEGVVAALSGLVAGVLILASALVKTILPLRWLAVGSNIGFMVYGALTPAYMVLVLHALLLPVNLVRGVQMQRLIRRVRASAAGADTSGIWMRRYMKPRSRRAGAVLFKAGDRADRLYFLVEGTIEIVEQGFVIQAGQMFGEIAFFLPDGQRTGTARCVTACKLLSIDEATFKQLYYQNPEFGFEVVRLIAGRLSREIHQLQGQLAKADASGVPPPHPPAAQ